MRDHFQNIHFRPRQTPSAAPLPSPATTNITSEILVRGMTCQSCVRHVTDALQNVTGVASASVDLATGLARVVWKAGAVKEDSRLVEAIKATGYSATPRAEAQEVELTVHGMTCNGCARSVAEALRGVPGVATAVVQLDEGRATVRWQPGATTGPVEILIEALRKAGFKAAPRDSRSPSTGAKSWSPLEGWRFNIVAGPLLTLPLLVLEWGLGVGAERWYHWLAFFLVLPIQTLCGARFYRGAWNQLKVGGSNMDTLVSLGSTTAFLFSTWGLFSGWSGHLFFMESAAIITLISVGHWIEARAATRAAKSLRALLNLAPPTARLLGPDGTETEVPVARLRIGDSVLLKPGDRIPTDGEVAEGASAVDESMLTGESLPVDKTVGAKLYAGTANQNGRIVLRVTGTGESTALSQIIAVVQRAQNSRANIQKLGDRVSSVFVPVVVLIALGTGLWWGFAPGPARATSDWFGVFLWHPHHPEGVLAAAIYHAAAVLIIACPCAMGLATPVAIMAGANAAAERGILIRDGIALEKSGRLTAVLFDKTGTLTEGKLAVAAMENCSRLSFPDSTLAAIAVALAKPSLHPLSQAVARLEGSALATVDWREIRGSGVTAKIDFTTDSGTAPASDASRTFRMGSLSWLREEGIDSAPAAAFQKEWTSQGATLLGVAAGDKLIGLLALRDTLKASAGEVIQQLEAQGKRVYLVTGDGRLTASAIARQAGIRAENVFAEIRPESKAKIVRELQERGERVAFIGDGINDAPALEQADLGIAVAQASDVAREAADIILLKSDIHAIPEALALAQATLRTIKQNLFWAFFYNAAGIPLAALGFMSPVFSALAMGLSDLIVIGNALRLRRRGR
jgi:Cu+-exporting ATPase